MSEVKEIQFKGNFPKVMAAFEVLNFLPCIESFEDRSIIQATVYLLQIKDLEAYSNKFKEIPTKEYPDKRILDQKQLKFSTLGRMFEKKKESDSFFVVNLIEGGK